MPWRRPPPQLAVDCIQVVQQLVEDPTPLLGGIGGSIAFPKTGNERLDLLQVEGEGVGERLPADGEKRDQIDETEEGKEGKPRIENGNGFHAGEPALHEGDQRFKEISQDKREEKTGDGMPKLKNQSPHNDHGNHGRGNPYRKGGGVRHCAPVMNFLSAGHRQKTPPAVSG